MHLCRRRTDQFAQWAPHQKKPRSSVRPDHTSDQAAGTLKMPSLSKSDYENVSHQCLYFQTFTK